MKRGKQKKGKILFNMRNFPESVNEPENTGKYWKNRTRRLEDRTTGQQDNGTKRGEQSTRVHEDKRKTAQDKGMSQQKDNGVNRNGLDGTRRDRTGDWN